MDVIARPLAAALSFFYDLIPNYAAAICMLTLAVMIVLFPLMLKSMRSSLAMQQLAPELKKLQDKHKNDRQKLMEETQALYRDNGISPLSGCFPVLLQMPILFGLYQAIYGLGHHNVEGKAAPRYLNPNSHLYTDLANAGGKMNSFGMDLALKATSHHASFMAAVPYFVLILAMVAANYYQQYQTLSRTPQTDNPQAQQMRMMTKFFPPFFGLMALGFQAGLVLYWLFSSVIRIAMQWGMYKYDPVLKQTVKDATDEAERFLHEDDRKKAKQPRQSKKSTSANKKGL